MNPHATESARDTLLRHMVEALLKDGYTEPGATSEEHARAFERMRSDAAEGRKKPTVASSREVALSFLHSTVEDANKPMSERMDAAHLLLMHNSEEK